MKSRRPAPPTHRLKTAIRKIDKIVWKLHDEQLAAYIAYVLAVSQGEKREIRKLFGAKFTAFGDLSAELERKLTPKGRRRAVRLTAYEAEMAALHDATQRLQDGLAAGQRPEPRKPVSPQLASKELGFPRILCRSLPTSQPGFLIMRLTRKSTGMKSWRKPFLAARHPAPTFFKP